MHLIFRCENCSIGDYENLRESPDFNKYYEKLYNFQDELCEEVERGDFGKAFYL